MTTKNGKNGSVIDAKELLDASPMSALTPEVEVIDYIQTLETESLSEIQDAIDPGEELDYAPVKSLACAMLIAHGTRINHWEEVKGLCAEGYVSLQVHTERIIFGRMTRETLQIDSSAIAFCYDAEFSSEDVLAIALDAKKAWCLGFKTQDALDKLTRDKERQAGKVSKQQALLAKLKARQAK